MTFTDPIVGGGGTLIREEIKSANYVPGVSGWVIRRDGTFEFSGGTFRGDVIVADPDGSAVSIMSGDGGRIRFTPEDVPGVVPGNDGQIFGGYVSAAGGYEFLTLTTPSATVDGFLITPGSLHIRSSIANNPTYDSPSLQFNGDFQLRDVDQGRGFHHYAGAAATISGVTTVETVALTVPSKTYYANRLYRVVLTGRFNQDTAGSGLFMRLRKTNAAGAIVVTLGRMPITGNVEYAPPAPFYFRVGAADVTTVLAFNIASSVGLASWIGPRSLSVWDDGLGEYMPEVPILS